VVRDGVSVFLASCAQKRAFVAAEHSQPQQNVEKDTHSTPEQKGLLLPTSLPEPAI
jgi:hypothetical protein